MGIDPKKLRFVNNLALTTLGILMLLGGGLVSGELKSASKISEEKLPGGCGVVYYNHNPNNNDSIVFEGKLLFDNNCIKCHLINRKMTGPALLNVRTRWADSTLLYQWIRSPFTVIESGDAYSNEIYNLYNSICQGDETLSDADIYSILTYIEN